MNEQEATRIKRVTEDGTDELAWLVSKISLLPRKCPEAFRVDQILATLPILLLV